MYATNRLTLHTTAARHTTADVDLGEQGECCHQRIPDDIGAVLGGFAMEPKAFSGDCTSLRLAIVWVRGGHTAPEHVVQPEGCDIWCLDLSEVIELIQRDRCIAHLYSNLEFFASTYGGFKPKPLTTTTLKYDLL